MSWSDGGAQNHDITAPAGTSSYTATYATHADLGVSVTPSPEPVGAGAALTYTLNVANAGPSQANSVSLTDSLPAGVTFGSATGTGCDLLGHRAGHLHAPLARDRGGQPGHDQRDGSRPTPARSSTTRA